MSRDRIFSDGDYACGLRAAGVLVREGRILAQRDKDGVVIGWLPVGELRNLTVYPEFLAEEIYRLSEPVKRFISRG